MQGPIVEPGKPSGDVLERIKATREAVD
jgi:hypothetical protein